MIGMKSWNIQKNLVHFSARLMLASLIAAVLAADSLAQPAKFPEVPQTIEYERYLLSNEGPLAKYDLEGLSMLVRDQVRVIQSLPDPLALPDLKGVIGIELSFIDLSSSNFNESDIRKLVDELNSMFSFGGDGRDELVGIRFCHNLIGTPLGLAKLPNLTTNSETSYDELFKKFQGVAATLEPLLNSAILDRTTIPVIIVDGNEDLLGFASSVPHDGLTDAVVIASELLRGSVLGRSQGKTIGQLIANYIGLKPIWYSENEYGDMIMDTPCHNGPNYGMFSEDEIHLSMCDGMPRELVHNYMDNSYEEMRHQWTDDQIERIQMLLSIDKFRAALVKAPCIEVELQDNPGAIVEDGRSDASQVIPPSLLVQPNPVSDLLTVFLSSSKSANLAEPIGIYLTDGGGQRVNAISTRLHGGSYTIDVAGLSPGNYFVTLILYNGAGVTEQFYKF